MASWSLSRDVSSQRDYSGGTFWRPPPLPRPEKGDNVRPAPLWERGFCRNAYGHSITWETFCENKRFIGFYPNVMDWDDSGALKSFLDAKERFRARFHGESYEDPKLDPDMYIDEVDHHCKVDPEVVADLDKVAGVDDLADLSLGGMANLTPMSWGAPIGNLIPWGWGQPVPNLEPTGWGDEPSNPTPNVAWGQTVPDLKPTGWGDEPANLIPSGWGQPVPDLKPTGWGDEPANLIPSGWGEPVPDLKPTGWGDEPANPTPNVVWEGQGNQTAEVVSSGHQQGVDPRPKSSGTARMLPGGGRTWVGGVSGGRGCSGSGNNWNGGGRGNQRNQDVGRHQMRSDGGGMKRNKNVVEHQPRSGGRQQGQKGRRMEWRPVQRNGPPQDGPAA